MSLFLCLTRRGSPHHPLRPSLPACTLCQSSLSPLPFVRVILSPAMRRGEVRRGASGDAACCTPTHRRNSGDETQGRKRSRGLSGRSVRERVRVLCGASVDTATPTSPRRFKYKRRRARPSPPPPPPPRFLSGTPRVPDAGHAPVGFSAEGVRSHTRVPFLHTGN